MKTFVYSFFGVFSAFLVLMMLFRDPSVTAPVNESRLSISLQLAAEYPKEAAPYVEKIHSSTLTNGDFVQLNAAISAAHPTFTAADKDLIAHASYLSISIFIGAVVILLILSLIKNYSMRKRMVADCRD